MHSQTWVQATLWGRIAGIILTLESFQYWLALIFFFNGNSDFDSSCVKFQLHLPWFGSVRRLWILFKSDDVVVWILAFFPNAPAAIYCSVSKWLLQLLCPGVLVVFKGRDKVECAYSSLPRTADCSGAMMPKGLRISFKRFIYFHFISKAEAREYKLASLRSSICWFTSYIFTTTWTVPDWNQTLELSPCLPAWVAGTHCTGVVITAS